MCVSYMRELALIIWRFVHSISGFDWIYLGRFWLELGTVYWVELKVISSPGSKKKSSVGILVQCFVSFLMRWLLVRCQQLLVYCF